MQTIYIHADAAHTWCLTYTFPTCSDGAASSESVCDFVHHARIFASSFAARAFLIFLSALFTDFLSLSVATESCILFVFFFFLVFPCSASSRIFADSAPPSALSPPSSLSGAALLGVRGSAKRKRQRPVFLYIQKNCIFNESHVCLNIQLWIYTLCCIFNESHVFVVRCMHSITQSSFIRDMTHSPKTWLIHQRHDSLVWDATHLVKIWLIHPRHDSFIRDTTHSPKTRLIHERHDSSIRVTTHSSDTRLIHGIKTSL